MPAVKEIFSSKSGRITLPTLKIEKYLSKERNYLLTNFFTFDLGVISVIPFNHKIKNMGDVKKEYSSTFDINFLNRKVVKNFIQDELEILIEDELDRCLWAEEKPKSKAALTFIFTPTAQAKALYHFLWSIDHITDQMVKWGWDPRDIVTLMKRMQQKGYDPYSIEEDTAGQFIESLKGYGFKKIETKNGDKFYLYNPKGH